MRWCMFWNVLEVKRRDRRGLSSSCLFIAALIFSQVCSFLPSLLLSLILYPSFLLSSDYLFFPLLLYEVKATANYLPLPVSQTPSDSAVFALVHGESWPEWGWLCKTTEHIPKYSSEVLQAQFAFQANWQTKISISAQDWWKPQVAHLDAAADFLKSAAEGTVDINSNLLLRRIFSNWRFSQMVINHDTSLPAVWSFISITFTQNSVTCAAASLCLCSAAIWILNTVTVISF